MAFLRAQSRSAERTLGWRRRPIDGATHLERVRVGLRVRAAALEVLATHETRVHAFSKSATNGGVASGEGGGARRVEERAASAAGGHTGGWGGFAGVAAAALWRVCSAAVLEPRPLRGGHAAQALTEVDVNLSDIS
eukprot:scaffold32135_cov29-Phaeocystis_antarctica.AAC.1